jgi:hypothetical protein
MGCYPPADFKSTTAIEIACDFRRRRTTFKKLLRPLIAAPIGKAVCQGYDAFGKRQAHSAPAEKDVITYFQPFAPGKTVHFCSGALALGWSGFLNEKGAGALAASGFDLVFNWK